MVVASVFIILLFFEPSIIYGRAYNCYSSLPCPLTNPATEPAWSYDVSAHSMPPINMFITQPENKPDVPAPVPTPIVTPVPIAEPVCPPKKKKEKKEREDFFFSSKFFTNLFAIPGALADTFLNGEIVI